MKPFLISLLILISLGLCGICAVQWKREADLHAQIKDITAQLIAENKLRIEFEEKATRFEQEITRLTHLRAETEAALVVATEQVKDVTSDQTSRGFSIAVLMNELIAANGELNAFKNLAGKGTDAVKQRNAEVTEQNAAIVKQNAQLKQLAGERDNAINQLNARTREFNELAEKYNKLAKSVEASR
jgi:chromosome segregation ATPase